MMANFFPLEQDGALAAIVSAAVVALKAAGDRALSAYRVRRERAVLEPPPPPMPPPVPQSPPLLQPAPQQPQPARSTRTELQALFQLVAPVEDALRTLKRSPEPPDNNGIAHLAEVAHSLGTLVSALNLNRLSLTAAASGLVDQLAGRYADIARVGAEAMDMLKSGRSADEPSSSFQRQLMDTLPELSSLRKQIESDFRESFGLRSRL
jgi:hypothetical protein